MTTPTIQFKVATAVLGRHDDNVPSNDPDLTISLPAGVYALWGGLVFESQVSNSAQFGFATDVATSSESVLAPVCLDSDTGLQGANCLNVPISSTPGFALVDVNNLIVGAVNFSGMFELAAPGTLSLQWAQSVSKPDDVVRGKNSWFAVAPLN